MIKHYPHIDVDKTAKHFGGTYVCDTSHPEDDTLRVSIFYNPVPHPEGPCYMGAFLNINPLSPKDSVAMVCDGAFVEHQKFLGVVADNGDIIYSSHRHDYVVSEDKSVIVDGGRSFFRHSLDGGLSYEFNIDNNGSKQGSRICKLSVKDGVFAVEDNNCAGS